jgi:hypothetical protein
MATFFSFQLTLPVSSQIDQDLYSSLTTDHKKMNERNLKFGCEFKAIVTISSITDPLLV